jgi:peroxiredoxin/uncharacterized protein (DUF1330 family)
VSGETIMSALLITIGRLRPEGGTALEQYAAGVIPLIAAAGGEVIVRGMPRETVVWEGDRGDRPDLVATMRFPSAEAIRTFLDSREYQSHRASRDAAFEDLHSYIADDLGPKPETKTETLPPRLRNGQLFPNLAIQTVRDRAMQLPRDLAGSYAVILFYRGSWCPYCRAQLAAFSRATESLRAIGVKVVAVSVDDEATSRGLVDKLRLSFPVGFGADVGNIVTKIGAYAAEDSAYVQSTGFVLDREGRIVTAVYSSGAIGRLVPEDVAGLVQYLEKSHAASRSSVTTAEAGSR